MATDRFYPGSPAWPYPPEKTETLETHRVMIAITSDEFNQLQTPIIVESWAKAVGPHAYGKARRAWLKEFTASERKRAGQLHSRFHKWHLRTGTPERIVLHLETINFVKRLVDFFATQT